MKMKALVFFLAVLLSGRAHANIVGTDAQNFNSITSGLDFVTVHSSETLDPGVLNIGLFGNYARNTFSYLGGTTKEGGSAQDGMSSADFNFGMGLKPNWDIGISFPMLLGTEDSSSGKNRVILRSNGLTEVRINTKYRFWGNDSKGIAGIFSAGQGLIKNNPYAGEEAGPTLNFELAADTQIGKKASVGANIGYRWRNTGRKNADFDIEPLGDQIITSGAISYLVNKADTKVIGEVFGSWPTAKKSLNTDRSQSTFEWIGGLKHDFNRSISIHAGGGTRIFNGTSSPDWRVYAGLNYVMGPLWGKPKPFIRKITPRFKEDEIAPPESANPFWMEPVESKEVFIADEIIFGFGSDRVVNQGARDALSQLAEYLEKPPKMKLLIIEGHTDSIGSADYNLDLSLKRAANIRKYLVETAGLDPKKVRAKGYGETRPIADNGNFQGRSKNRRVEFKVYREGSEIPEDLNNP